MDPGTPRLGPPAVARSASPGESGLGQIDGWGAPKAAALVPVKAFYRAKMRLAPVLGAAGRAELARQMAAHVLKAAFPLPAIVVCDDEEVAIWAEDLGARALREPGLGLNGAVNAAVAQLAQEGYERLVVAHADLPRASHLASLAELDGIALVPDRHQEGTNVISLPTSCGFRFSYGPGSFARHRAEAQRTGHRWTVLHDPALAWDVDIPADIVALKP